MSRDIKYIDGTIPTVLDIGKLLAELKSGLSMTVEEKDNLGISYNPGGGVSRKKGSVANSEEVEQAELVICRVPEQVTDLEVNSIVAAHSG